MAFDVDTSVFRITSSKNERLFGTCFVIHRDEEFVYLLTCAHVVRDIQEDNGEARMIINKKEVLEIAVIGEPDGLDLAVVKVAASENMTEVNLCKPFKDRKIIQIVGYFRSAVYQKRAKINGILLVHSDIDSDLYGIIRSWAIQIQDETRLDRGFSGSPIIDIERNSVVGVLITELDGKFGEAISIEALDKLWTDRPVDFFIEDEFLEKEMVNRRRIGQKYYSKARNRANRATLLEQATGGDFDRQEAVNYRKEAIDLALAAVDFGYVEPEVFYFLGGLHELIDNYSEAFECYSTCIRLNGKERRYFLARRLLGDLLAKKKRNPYRQIAKIAIRQDDLHLRQFLREGIS